jgi:hypothetical protein
MINNKFALLLESAESILRRLTKANHSKRIREKEKQTRNSQKLLQQAIDLTFVAQILPACSIQQPQVTITLTPTPESTPEPTPTLTPTPASYFGIDEPASIQYACTTGGVVLKGLVKSTVFILLRSIFYRPLYA